MDASKPLTPALLLGWGRLSLSLFNLTPILATINSKVGQSQALPTVPYDTLMIEA